MHSERNVCAFYLGGRTGGVGTWVCTGGGATCAFSATGIPVSLVPEDVHCAVAGAVAVSDTKRNQSGFSTAMSCMGLDIVQSMRR